VQFLDPLVPCSLLASDIPVSILSQMFSVVAVTDDTRCYFRMTFAGDISLLVYDAMSLGRTGNTAVRIDCFPPYFTRNLLCEFIL
jgi:hypothetical protein